MKNGSVVNLASFTHHLPGMQYGYRAQKGQVFVAVILGTADKRDPGVFDAEQALRKLAWVPRDELDELKELLLSLRTNADPKLFAPGQLDAVNKALGS